MRVEVRGTSIKDVEHALSILKNKLKREGVLEELHRRRYFETKRERRIRKGKEGIARAIRFSKKPRGNEY